jgi:hypothetical protein
MSYIVKRLPEVNKLQSELEQNPNNIVYYSKYGGYVGSIESMDFLDIKLDEYYDNK